MAFKNTYALAALLLLGLEGVEAEQIVWSSFAYILHGETTPLSTSSLSSSLTAYGAQQMFAQGQMFRYRYLTTANTGDASDDDATGSFPIVGLSQRALDNSQLDIVTNADTYNVASAMAFLQGLYPPTPGAFVENDGDLNASTLSNGSMVEFPLDGYQYPNIQATSILDEKSYQIQGHVSCSTYMGSQLEADSDEIIRRNHDESRELYGKLSNSSVLAGTEPFQPRRASFDHAYELWDYAAYQYSHNATVRDALGAETLGRLGQLASDQQFDYNGNLSASGLQKGDMIRAIAGRTLAGRVLAQLRSQIAGEYPQKLTLMVGSFEPMLAFFAYLTAHPHCGSGTIPEPGSAMVFELFSVSSSSDNDNSGNDNSSSHGDSDSSSISKRQQQYPTEDDLWVRFLYRSGTNASSEPSLTEYPLFGRGNSQSSMKWQAFHDAVSDIAVAGLSDWCRLCSAPTLYCMAAEANNNDGYGGSSPSSSWPSTFGGSFRRRMSPTLAGVIGALVTLAAVALAGIAAFVIGGLRVRRRRNERRDAAVQRSNSLGGGGFKGAEKMASDRDLAVARGGGRHERVGSWEMGAPATPPNVARRGEAAFGAMVVRELDDDGVSILEEEPVKPRETV
ncbi:Histidine acid phosphatase [Apiospora hydei]|uniref:Histidine acid phosphatase n=1 Tax=Apiospora hydei TaxID=1337664 RepID=A0ABR1XEJ3_9PEZI